MSFAITRTTGNGSTPTFTIGFSYRDEAGLIVKVNGVTQTLGTHFRVSTGGTIIDFLKVRPPLVRLLMGTLSLSPEQPAKLHA